MVKKIKVVFLIAFLAVLVLPTAGVMAAASSYQVNICKWKNDVTKQELDTGSCTAQTVCYEGMVPCGGDLGNGDPVNGRCPAKPVTTPVPCQFCHFFMLADNIVKFVLIDIVPTLAVFMLVIGGAIYFFGGAKPDLVKRGHTLIKGVVIGLFLIYGAYLIVGEVLSLAGMSKHNPLNTVFTNGVFSLQCPIYLPPK